MKVIQIVPSITVSGGGERIATELAIALAGLGVDSHLASLYDPDPTNLLVTELRDAGVHVHGLSKTSGPDQAAATRIRRLIADNEPDVVHSHLAGLRYSLLLGRGMRRRQIHTIHNDPRHETSPVITSLHRFAFRSGVTPVILSKRFAEPFAQTYGRRITPEIVPNGVAAPNNDEAGSPLDSSAEGSAIQLASINRLEPQKRVDVAIRAVGQAIPRLDRAVTLRIFGDGSLNDDLRSLAVSLGIADSVTFSGVVDSAWPVLAGTDVLLLTSDYEGMPLVLIEAAMAGVPAIATNVGAVADVVEHRETGILVDCQDVGGIADAIVRLAQDDSERISMARHARVRSAAFLLDRMVARYVDLYERKVKVEK